MDLNAFDPRDQGERAAAQAFQSESSEHVPTGPDEGLPPLTGPAAAYQHEDDEFDWPTD